MPDDLPPLAIGLRQAIAKIGRTRAEQCRRIGVTPTTLVRWCDGSVKPSEQNLARVARLSGISQEEIRSGNVDAFAR